MNRFILVSPTLHLETAKEEFKTFSENIDKTKYNIVNMLDFIKEDVKTEDAIKIIAAAKTSMKIQHGNKHTVVFGFQSSSFKYDMRIALNKANLELAFGFLGNVLEQNFLKEFLPEDTKEIKEILEVTKFLNNKEW